MRAAQVKTALNLGAIGAGTLLAANAALGGLYLGGCLRSGRDFDGCFDRAMQISGLGSGGPLAAALGIGGYAIGQKRGWEQGYNTLNPNLRSPDVIDPTGDSASRWRIHE